MPALSLVVCVSGERDLLERLLNEADGCYDDLVVVHDGPEGGVTEEQCPVGAPARELALDYADLPPDAPLTPGYSEPPGPGAPGSVQELVKQRGGRFFLGPKCWQQEPHWGFAWWQARHDWILRLDADEFPSPEMKTWLRTFRDAPAPPVDAPGFTCYWPLWSGARQVSRHWPHGRIFLIDRRRTSFFGMAENTPLFKQPASDTGLELKHQPKRCSYGIVNLAFRRQGPRWRLMIARSLLGFPADLPCWNVREPGWPGQWDDLRRAPLYQAVRRLIRYPLSNTRDMLRGGDTPIPSACISSGLHHFLMGLRVFVEQRKGPRR